MKLATTLEPADVRTLRKLHTTLGKILDALPTDVGAGRRSAKSARVQEKPPSNMTSSPRGM